MAPSSRRTSCRGRWPTRHERERGKAARRAIGLPSTVEQAIEVLPVGGTAVLAGMTPFGVRASFEVIPSVDGGRSIHGSNYGAAVASVDFPRYADLFLSGRRPIDRLVSHRIGLEDVESAFDAMRRGEGLRQVVTFPTAS